MNETVLPALIKDTSLLLDEDIKGLREGHIPTPLTTLERLGIIQNDILKALQCPYHTLTLSYSANDLTGKPRLPSSLYLQLEKIEDIPYKLYRMKNRGVEFVLCDTSLRSHNKYYHAFKSFPNDCIITIDDDMFYRSDFIENLINNHKKYPDLIITNWAKKISQEKPIYNCWGEVNDINVSITLLPIGVAGVLYPPHSMYKDVLDDNLIKKLSITADDVWLTAMALLNGTKKYFSGYKQNFLPILIKNNVCLDTLNVRDNVNQKCVDNINNYYKEKIGICPFIDLIKEKKE
jgi:hypothetical protein